MSYSGLTKQMAMAADRRFKAVTKQKSERETVQLSSFQSVSGYIQVDNRDGSYKVQQADGRVATAHGTYRVVRKDDPCTVLGGQIQ